MLGQVHQASGMADEASTNELTDEGGQIRGDSLHSVSEVIRELRSVFGDGDDLVTEGVDVCHIGVGNLSSHGQLCGGFDGSLEILGEDELERSGGGVGSEACVSERPGKTSMH